MSAENVVRRYLDRVSAEMPTLHETAKSVLQNLRGLNYPTVKKVKWVLERAQHLDEKQLRHALAPLVSAACAELEEVVTRTDDPVDARNVGKAVAQLQRLK